MEVNEKQMEVNEKEVEINQKQTKIINQEINQDIGQLTNLFGEFIETANKELMKVGSIRIDMNTERLEDKLKKLQKEIDKKKSG